MDGDTGNGTPTSGSSKYFGLTQLGSGAMAAFRIFGSKIRCFIVSETGAQTIVDLPWNADWSATEISYRISWAGQAVTFYINRVQVAVISDNNNPRSAMSVFIQNDDADNLDLSLLEGEASEENE